MQLLISVFMHTLSELDRASECHSPYDQIQAAHSLVSPCTSYRHVQRLRGNEEKRENPRAAFDPSKRSMAVAHLETQGISETLNCRPQPP